MARANGKTALITGSTDGVGRMVAERLGQDGWRVLVHGRDRGRGEQVVASINAGGGAAEFLQADFSALCGSAAPGRRGAAHDEAPQSPHQ
jgi:NAD(P)-dependent dehydrogenase (short-subunit alcohol dehydrogenase family)